MRETEVCVKKQMIEKAFVWSLRKTRALIDCQKQGRNAVEFIYPFFCVF